MREATSRAREEARAIAERERGGARKARAQRRRVRSVQWDKRADALTARLRGGARGTRRRIEPLGRRIEPLARRLEPAGRSAGSALGRIAPYVSKALMLVMRVPAALIAIGLDLVLDAAGWVRSRVGPLSAGVGEFTLRAVTPVRTLLVVSAGAAVALAASQFIDYRGVAVGAPAYEGAIGAVAPAPFTDLKTSGSAHAYALVPLALIAALLAVATARGRWRMGRAVGLIGLAGIVVGIAIDAPQGLDTGNSGVAYLGTDARLIEGFWAQMAASATLLFAGPLLGLYAKRQAAGDRGRERSSGRSRKRRPRPSSKRRPAPARRASEAKA